MRWLHSLIALIRGRNSLATPASVVKAQMRDLRPLPMGVQEFHEWSDRIIAGAMMTATPDSLKFALAEMIMHMPPTESHCADIVFIHRLRKAAANQVAYAMMEQLRTDRKAVLARQEAEQTGQAIAVQ